MNLLHTMLRVGNLQRSIDFYTQVLGMQLLRTTQRPEQKYDLAFVGYGSNPDACRDRADLQLRRRQYELGTAFGHLAIGVPDVAATCEAVRAKAAALGGAITREAGPVKGGTTVIAFITDPDGYKIELIERDAAALTHVPAQALRAAGRGRDGARCCSCTRWPRWPGSRPTA